jgi:predicted SprT family Zn-dependent metalloprotease
MKFPSNIKSQCHGAKNTAEQLIEAKGKKLKEKWDCSVYPVPGQKRFHGVWAWKDANSNMYVCGLCNGKEIWIAVDPRDNKSLHNPTLIHEFCHYWLMSNYGDYTHNPILDDVVFNWRHARQVVGSSTNNKPISVTLIKNGKPYHYDFVPYKE